MEWTRHPDGSGIWLFQPCGSSKVYEVVLVEIPEVATLTKHYAYRFTRGEPAEVFFVGGQWLRQNKLDAICQQHSARLSD